MHLGAGTITLCLGLSTGFLLAPRTRTIAWKPGNGEREQTRYGGSLFELAPPKSAKGGPCAGDDDKMLLLAKFNASVFRHYVDNFSNGSSSNDNGGDNACTRGFKVPRSVLAEEGAARVRCTSSLANSIRLKRGCASNTKHVFSPASICVFYLHYRNLDNLLASVKTHSMRSLHPDLVSHTVLTMDEDESDVQATRLALERAADVHRLTFPPGTRGGDPLPLALRLISLLSSCPLTVVSDSDAFMLKDGWDQRLLTGFLHDPQLVLFASNPRHRSHGEAFRDVAEWNWMAYRTSAFAGLVIGAGTKRHIDVGHYYSACVPGASHRLLLQGTAWPYAGKAATVVTDTDGSPWILHLFYASRHANEPGEIKAEARRYSLSNVQLLGLRANLTQARCLNPRVAFGK